MAALSGRLPALSLRWRLAAWVAAVMLIGTAVTFVVVYRGSGTQLRAQIDREMQNAADDLAHAIAVSRGRSPQSVVGTADRYIEQQPFRSTSTLLMAVVPGPGTGPGHALLFADGRREAIESPAEEARARRVGQHLTRAPLGYSTFHAADQGQLRLLKRQLRVAGGLGITIGVAEPLRTVAHAQAGVANAFVLAGLIALVGALLAAYLIGTRMSRPLRRMAAVASQVDAGDLRPRIGDVGARGDEVGILAEAFDNMLDRLTAAFAGQRAFVADASHELRTPLTVIRGQIELLARLHNPPAAEVRRVERLVGAEIARITRMVDDLLLLAKTEHNEFLRREPIDLVPFVQELWRVEVALAARRFELGSVPAGTLTADPDRLTQALRNLLANAIQSTADGEGWVRLEAKALPHGQIAFCVDDDGPGIPPGERERVFDRFNRLDGARDRAAGGSGLGLAIVRAIADAHGGGAVAVASPAGGARLELRLPGFRLAQASRPSRAPSASGRAPSKPGDGAVRPDAVASP